ncbi:MAG TPA: GYD domain-containing protein [Thermodesulfobacteriota bacterium]|nr:GYD domain-containing protein [Thermodesulfobacteriota bacterium]
MNTYILLSKLTSEGRKTIKDRPDRIREVDKELENMNVRVVEQYATLGPYDFVNIVEAPDNETISKVSVDLCSRGTVEIMTLAAISVDSFISSLGSGKKTKAGKARKAKAKPSGKRK